MRGKRQVVQPGLQKHVLITVNAAWNVWNFRRPVIAALLAQGHTVTVLAPDDDYAPKLEALGCRFIPLAMSVDGLNPVQDLKLVWRFRRIFRAERPDIVLSYTVKNNVFGAFAARLAGVPFVPNVTGLGTAFLSGRILQTIAEILYRGAFAALPVVFFQNDDDRALFEQRRLVRTDQARMLPGSGIDLVQFAAAPLPPQDTPPTFLMIARLLRDKGVLEYVDAARRVKAEHPQARFQILGGLDAVNRTAIGKDMVDQWCRDGVIDYLGTTDDVRPFIEAAHCVVLPSYREGAPRTLIEAAAMARPLIATDVPGCRAVIDDGVSGYLCQVRSGESLAAACLKFLRAPHDGWAEMGRAGRAKMERQFDQALVVARYLEAIDEWAA